MIGVVPCISVPVGAQSNVNLESVPSLTSDFGVSTYESKNVQVDTASDRNLSWNCFRVEHHLPI